MKILALEEEVPGVQDTSFTPFLRDEARRVWELMQEGVIRETYFDQNRHTAVLILECEDAKEAERILDTLPLVREGLITFQAIPLVPYSGFSRLFVQDL